MICSKNNKGIGYLQNSAYLEELYKNYPVLWVDDYSDITKTLLTDNQNLFEQAQNIDLNLLDLYSVFNRAVKNAKDS